MKSRYIEPETDIDPSESLDYLYKNAGKTVLKPKEPLPPRDDIIVFSEEKHRGTLQNLIQWRDCPLEHRSVIEAIIIAYWDAFDPSGALRPVRGHISHIDVGDHKPVCCKVPRHGPHESRVMDKLLAELESKGVIEDDCGPWGAMIVLAAKPNQDHVHWRDYVFRLCVSFRMLNAITRPFAFPIPRCDDEAERMGPCEKGITADLDSGYWQTLVDEMSRDKTGFFTPEGKKHFRHLPMGVKNAAPFFVCMMMELKHLWDYDFFQTEEGIRMIERAQELCGRLAEQAIQDDGLKVAAELLLKRERPDASIIIDDLLVFAKTTLMLVAHFMAVLKALMHHRVAIELRKTRFLPSRAEFVGLDLLPEGNAPAQSKNEAIRKLGKPLLFGDLRMLIGFFGFYSKWIPWCEEVIGPWRAVLKKKPPVDVDKQEEARLFANLWQPKEDSLLHVMKEAILSGPVLKRLDWDRPFWVKTDWSGHAKGGALCQPECTPEAEEELRKQREEGIAGSFDKTISGLRLRPVQFMSQKNPEAEHSCHSSVGEWATGRWAFIKWRRCLWYRSVPGRSCTGRYSGTHTCSVGSRASLLPER